MSGEWWVVNDHAATPAVALSFAIRSGSPVAQTLLNVLGVNAAGLLGGVDFSDLKVVLKDAVGEVPAVTLNYGSFIQTCVDFLIVAFAIFMLIKALNSMQRKKEEVPAAPPPPQEVLLTEIRDLLKSR